jgi:hypothetical protein
MFSENARSKRGQTGSFRVDEIELPKGALDIAGGKAPLIASVLPVKFP